MRNYTKIDKRHIQINALFLQPTTLCALNCKGCYVKGWAKNEGFEGFDPHLSFYVWEEIMYTMAGLRNSSENRLLTTYHTNQMTFALDDLPASNIRYHMQDLAAVFFEAAYESKEKQTGTEFHITTSRLDNLNSKNYGYDNFANIDMLTVSMINLSNKGFKDLDALGKLRRENPDLHLNWNLHPAISIHEEEMDKHAKKIANVSEYVDSIYMVMHKPDLGYKLDTKVVTQYFKLLKKIKFYLKEKGQDPSKINIDGCIQDSKMYAEGKTGGCSSNISRFQIWPDGSVSGCPYSQRAVTKPPVLENTSTYTATKNILNNIREASKIYQFDSCRIPESLYPESEVVQLRPGRIKSLQLLED